MTRKLMLGIFLASFLLLINLAVAVERSSSGPAITKVAAVLSDCDCLKKDSAPPSAGLKADVLVEKPSRAIPPGPCWLECYWAWGVKWCFVVCSSEPPFPPQW